MTEAEDLRLVRECLDGNIKAFESIVDKYNKPIFNLALRMVRAREDAQDVAQAVFLKAYENLASFNVKYKFFSWIYRMAINEAINLLKQRKQVDELDQNLRALEKTPEEGFDESTLRGVIQEALMKLDIDYRAVVILKHFEDFSYEEIGYILDLPEKTVKSRLFTARQRLRDILIKEGMMSHD
jgi:RNA polymerase sigma-70 factor (ECF subfamily)